ncbi:hypothetical protein AUF12_04265 [Enterococcus avium]|nr:hypothetical protein AUF12_04265 [Enterococcus avium]
MLSEAGQVAGKKVQIKDTITYDHQKSHNKNFQDYRSHQSLRLVAFSISEEYRLFNFSKIKNIFDYLNMVN